MLIAGKVEREKDKAVCPVGLLQSGFQLLSGSTQPHESATEPSVEVSGLAKRGLHTNLPGHSPLKHSGAPTLTGLW